MQKIKVNEEACIGCGACVAIDPEHFEFNDEGLSMPTNHDNLLSQELASAIDSCPTSAISVVQDIDCQDTTNNNLDSECTCDECHCSKDDNCGCNCFKEE